MKTGRTAIHLGSLLPALVCAPAAFSWDLYAVDGFNPTTVQAPPPVFQQSGHVALPGMVPESGAPGELQRSWYVPAAGRDGRAFVERLPVGTFRPLASAPPPMDRSYKGYSFRPLGRVSGLPQAPAGLRRGITPPSMGVRTERIRELPDSGRYSDYGHGSPRFNFRPDRRPVRQRSQGYRPYDANQSAASADDPGGFQDFPATRYYAPQTVDGSQTSRW